MSKGRPLAEGRIRAMVKDYAETGRPVTEIARDHGVAPSAVTRHAREAGYSRLVTFTRRQRVAIADAYLEGDRTLKSVAEEYGCSIRYVCSLAYRRRRGEL